MTAQNHTNKIALNAQNVLSLTRYGFYVGWQGNAGGDAESGVSQGGNSYAKFSMGVSEGKKDPATGAWETTHSHWVEIIGLKDGAAAVAKVKKGDAVYVRGKLITEVQFAKPDKVKDIIMADLKKAQTTPGYVPLNLGEIKQDQYGLAGSAFVYLKLTIFVYDAGDIWSCPKDQKPKWENGGGVNTAAIDAAVNGAIPGAAAVGFTNDDLDALFNMATGAGATQPAAASGMITILDDDGI